jgi:hypothetical protein
LTVMPKKQPERGATGPMTMQPDERKPTAPTQMLPMMPGAKGAMIKGETKAPPPEKKQRTNAARAAAARITRRNSLRKQRDAQKS